jgi:HK97 family phage prohead protease
LFDVFQSERYVAIDDLEIRSTPTGRRLDAYIAVFNTETEIRDRDGHYMETIAPTAFDLSLAQRGLNFQVFYNHGRTIHGESSSDFSMPIGVPAEMRADGKGVWASTEIFSDDMGDRILERARNGGLRGMSFSGKFLRSRAAGKSSNGLGIKERTEIALIEYGPTPFPAYRDAAIVAVRSSLFSLPDDYLEQLRADPDLMARLSPTTPATGVVDVPATPPAPRSVELTPSQRRALAAVLSKKETSR